MIGTILALWLACPPTAEAAAAPRGDHFIVASGSNLIRWDPDPSELPIALVHAPSLPELPLWDLEATLAELPELADPTAPEWAAWLRWMIARAQQRPATAQSALVVALRSDVLRADRLAWWLSIAEPTLDDRDALLDAFESAKSQHARFLLATGLALVQWELACPVSLDLDGACRAPGTSMLQAGQAMVRREPIALESARYWTATANKLGRKLGPDDLAARSLLAELALVASSEDYELLLATRMPDDLTLYLNEWMRDSGVPKWERLYEQQLLIYNRSKRRLRAFMFSYSQCADSLHERHGDIARTEAQLAVRVLLQQTLLLLSDRDMLDSAGMPDDRAKQRNYREHPERRPKWFYYGMPDPDFTDDMAQQCVMIGTTLAGDSSVVEACRAVLVERGSEPPLAELIPQPRSSSVVHSPGVVGPEFL